MRIRLIYLVTILALALLALASTASAQVVTLTTAVRPIYLGAQGAIFADKPVSQTDIFLSWKNGLFADVWVSTGADTKLEFDKELDLIVGYAGARGWLKYSTDFEYFAIQGIDVVNANAELGTGPFFVKFEAYAPVKEGGPRSGFLPNAGFKVSGVPLFEKFESVKIDLAQWVKYDTGAFGFGKLWLLQGRLAGAYFFTEKIGVGAGMRWSVPMTEVEEADGRKGEIIWEASFSKRFGN